MSTEILAEEPHTPPAKTLDFDDDDIPSPEKTPKFARRKRVDEYEAEGKEHTIRELTKLIKSIHNDAQKTRKRFWLLNSLFAFLIIALFSFTFQPYCGSTLGLYIFKAPSLVIFFLKKIYETLTDTGFTGKYGPCRPCPAYANCGSFFIVNCTEGRVLKDGWVCARNDSVGDLSYIISIIVKKILEQKAWWHDCIGREKEKFVNIDVLYDLAFNITLPITSYSGSFHTAFEEMRYLVKENIDLYQFSIVENTIASNKFQGYFSCWKGLDNLIPYFKSLRITPEMKEKLKKALISIKENLIKKPETIESAPVIKLQEPKIEVTEKKEMAGESKIPVIIDSKEKKEESTSVEEKNVSIEEKGVSEKTV